MKENKGKEVVDEVTRQEGKSSKPLQGEKGKA